MNVLQRWRLNAERLAWRGDQPQVMRMALWIIPLLFGLLSVKLGQDYNWDLRNYHLYNAFAFLNGKMAIDLAPAQIQTYFNPTIDLLYYGLVKVLPGPVVGFIMGVLQGLNFILLVVIARALLPAGVDGGRTRLPLLLALAGMLGNGFISEFGNTMGDNLTALAVLGALALVLRQWPRLQGGAGAATLSCAGVVMGLGVGLKLTVAVFALALCLALLALPLRIVGRLRAAFVFGIGVLLGMAISGGHWYWKMWTLFGNPLFPQFNSVFHHPLAGPMSVFDTRFLPHGIEYLLWPVIAFIHPLRVSEIQIANPIWMVLYAAAAALLVKALLRHRGGAPAAQAGVPDRRVRMAAVFFALSYVIWMVVFGIYRYLIPAELLAPLMLWLLMHSLLPRSVSGKVTLMLLLCIIASNVPRKNWGYLAWAGTSFHAETPTFADPAQSLVLTVQHDMPVGWLVTMFPPQLAFAALGSNFPESPAYRQRVATMMAARSGPVYAMMDASGIQVDATLTAGLKAQAVHKDHELLNGATKVLSGYGLALDANSCTQRPAFIGAHRYYYQLCQVHTLAR